MRKRRLIFVFFFSTILIINIGLVSAAIAFITSPEDGVYAGEGPIVIEGYAEADEDAEFEEWILEMISFDEIGNIKKEEILISSQAPIGNPLEEISAELFTLNIINLPMGKYGLRLTARDRNEEVKSEIIFYRSQPITLNLINNIESDNEEFIRIGIILYNEEIDKHFFVDSSPFIINFVDNAVQGNGNLEEDTVCESSCSLTIDAFHFDQTPQEKLDIKLIGETKDGFYIFYKKYKIEEDRLINLETQLTNKIDIITQLNNKLEEYGKTIDERYISIDELDFKRETNLPFFVNVYTQDSQDLIYDGYSIVLHNHDNLPGERVAHYDLPIFYPFEEEVGENREIGVLQEFVRGNVNGDSANKIDLSDAIFLLRYLFLGGIEPNCLDAADANDNGRVDITDAIYILNHLFSGGPAIKGPYPTLGFDNTMDRFLCIEDLR